jgi:thioredoxin reductase
MSLDHLPIAIVGAGPVGLAAAAHLRRYDLDFVVLEAGEGVGAAVRQWRHVRLFSAWAQNLDAAAVELLRAGGWPLPRLSQIPTGDELIRHYLEPLAAAPALRGRIMLANRVRSITRLSADRSSREKRDELPFELCIESGGDGTRMPALLHARAVIDATGTLDTPKPTGANGLPIAGEAACRDLITYGVPSPRALAAVGERVLVVGSGHSAMHGIVALTFAAAHAGRTVHWAFRRENADCILCGDEADRFPARLVLQAKAREAVTAGRVRVHCDTVFARAERTSSGIEMTWACGQRREFDHVIVATGYKPDHGMTSELQMSLDPIYEAPLGMRGVLDLARGACAAVPAHGEAELRHVEPDFYIVGMRSFGRASSFLMRAGYEQVRTIAARLAGDDEASRPRPFAELQPMSLGAFLAQNPYYLEEAFG